MNKQTQNNKKQTSDNKNQENKDNKKTYLEKNQENKDFCPSCGKKWIDHDGIIKTCSWLCCICRETS